MDDTDEALAEEQRLGAELLLKEEREHEEYLYKRAVLEVIRELNEKWEVRLQEQAMKASVDCA